MILKPIEYKQTPTLSRTGQRDLLPSSVKNRNLNQNIIKVEDETAFAPVTFGNGQILTLTSTSTQNNERPMAIEKYWEVYIGTVTAVNNIFGANTTISTTGLNIRGPVFNNESWTGSKWISVQTLVIENVSAGSITVTAYVREKLIVFAPSITTT